MAVFNVKLGSFSKESCQELLEEIKNLEVIFDKLEVVIHIKEEEIMNFSEIYAEVIKRKVVRIKYE